MDFQTGQHVGKAVKKKKASNVTRLTPSHRSWWMKGLAAACIVGMVLWAGREWSLRCSAAAIATRDYPTAMAWLSRACWMGPSTARSRFLQARIDRKLGRFDQFARSLEFAKKAGFDSRKIELEQLLAVAQTGNLGLLESRFGKLLVDQNDQAAEICEAFVLGCMQNYRFPEARKILDVWQADYPEDPEPHYLRGRLLEHANDYDAADKEYRTALRIQPRHAAAAFNLGRLLTTRQKPAEARDVYALCAGLLQYPHPAWVGLGRSERSLGHTEAARKWLMKAAEGQDRPEVQEVYRWLGEPAEAARAQAAQELGQWELDQQHYSDAVHWFEKAVTANPRDWKIRHGFATALRGDGQTERAAKEFDEVNTQRTAWQQIDKLFDQLQLDPKSAAVRTQIGAAFLRHFSENQGLIWLNSALAYDPEFREAHRELAEYFEAHLADNPNFADLAKQHRRKWGHPSATPESLDSPP